MEREPLGRMPRARPGGHGPRPPRRRRRPPASGGASRVRAPGAGGRAGVRAVGSRGRRASGLDFAPLRGAAGSPRGGSGAGGACAPPRAVALAFRFLRARRRGGAAGAGRHTTSSLPMCCTGAASSSRTDLREHRLARIAIGVEHPHLDQFVREQVDVDFVQHARGKPLLPDAHDRVQPLRLGAQITALGRGQGQHGSSVAAPAGPGSTRPGRTLFRPACGRVARCRILAQVRALCLPAGNRR